MTSTDTISLILRIVLGVAFFLHGSQKVLGWFGGYGLEGTAGYFQQTFGIGAFLFYLAAFAEFLGGIGLLLGVLTRLASVGISIVMLTAIFVVHIPNGYFNGASGFEFPLAYLTIAVVIFLLGPGKFSVDKKLFGTTAEKGGN
jgi:putative oxidoreductase